MKRIIAVSLCWLCILIKPLRVGAQDINNVMVSIELKGASMEDAFSRIEKMTPFKFNYKSADITNITDIWYKRPSISVKQILDDLFSQTSLQYEVMQNYILVKRINYASARKVTIYGFVTTVNSGEALIGATISISGDKVYSSTTNAYGFYSISVPSGTYLLNCSYAGFNDHEKEINIPKTLQTNIGLTPKANAVLQTVTVSSSTHKNKAQQVITGNHRLNISDLKKMVMAGGEPDVLKSLQFLPGVQASNEGVTNLSIRGGSHDQNLILLDEAPVYNPSHTLGFFSAFNTDALKDVTLYKGVYPAQYGGRLSAVADIRMKEGNNMNHTVAGGIGLVASRLMWEGPLKKERSSFLLAGRYSNLGMLLNQSKVSKLIKARISNSRVSFYDLNAKFNSIISKKDRIYLSAYTGHDQFLLNVIDKNDEMEWGNTTITTRWNHVFNPGLFANTSLLYSNYNYSHATPEDTRNFTWKAKLQEVTFKTDLDWMINTSNLFKSGAGITSQNVLPGKIVPNDANSVSKEVVLKNRRSALLFAYISHELKINKRISINYGVRATCFAALGDALVYTYNADTTAVIDSTWYPKGKTIKSYFGAEPKITARLLTSPTSSVKISYGRNYQFQHLLTNSSVGLPTDIWIPSDTYFKPQYADQFSAGLYKTFLSDAYEASLEGYYNRSHNIIDFRDNAEVFLNDKIETQVLTGQGKGYGLEFLLKKIKGRSTGWISYTRSKSLRRINGVNNNEWYPPTYDRRHNFSLVYNCQLTEKISLSANWIYRSGGHTTVPVGTYISNGIRFIYYSKRNGYTLPANHRLDISASWKPGLRKNKKWQSEWVLSIYNAYNRKNVFALFVNQDPQQYANTQASMVYVLGFIPTITYNFKFQGSIP
ncbi:MAG TPA: carboxypeptidase-like regulatory domain-containing protein [Niastella sp.]